MRLVHLSDIHLGFRQFQRQTPAGGNQREADVAGTFTRAMDKVIELAPDIVLVGGDLFHTVRPTNPAILHAFAQFSRLREALPAAIVVIVAGNHDLPRSTSTRPLLRLFASLGIEVADTAPRRLRYEDRGLSVLAVPEMPGSAVDFEPDVDMRTNVLIAHGEVESLVPARAVGAELAMTIPTAAISHARWDYVGLGHYHVYRKVAERAFYSGSLDYVSSSIWEERAEETRLKLPGKVIIERDLQTGKQRVHPISPARLYVDLRPIEGQGMSAAELDREILRATARIPGGVDGKVVRQIVRDVPRHVVRDLDYKVLRDLQHRALHFHLDDRRPNLVPSRVGSGGPGRRPSLAEMLRDSLRNRVLASDVDRETLVELGLHYLREAEQEGAANDVSTAVEEP